MKDTYDRLLTGYFINYAIFKFPNCFFLFAVNSSRQSVSFTPSLWTNSLSQLQAQLGGILICLFYLLLNTSVKQTEYTDSQSLLYLSLPIHLSLLHLSVCRSISLVTISTLSLSLRQSISNLFLSLHQSISTLSLSPSIYLSLSLLSHLPKSLDQFSLVHEQLQKQLAGILVSLVYLVHILSLFQCVQDLFSVGTSWIMACWTEREMFGLMETISPTSFNRMV